MATSAVPAPLAQLPNALTIARLAVIPVFVALMVRAGGGHSWPGAEPYPGAAQATTREFDAAEEICRFARPLLTPPAARRLLFRT